MECGRMAKLFSAYVKSTWLGVICLADRLLTPRFLFVFQVCPGQSGPKGWPSSVCMATGTEDRLGWLRLFTMVGYRHPRAQGA